MTNPAKLGPLTIADLTAVWKSATDSSYADAFIKAGEGNGFEAYTQGFAQHARVSQAIDITTQACYVLPWSGQTNPPASGAQLATVTLTFARSTLNNIPIRLGAGSVFYDEETNDWGRDGSVPVITGRRYTLQTDLVFMPGDFGPVTAVAEAEFPGYGYNNPLPGTIKVFDQPGAGFFNSGASVVISTFLPFVTFSIVSANAPDMFVPEHVGQYVQFTSGSNNGLIARIVGFAAPSGINGSTVALERLAVIETTTVIATPFVKDEPVIIKNGATQVGTGKFVQSTVYPSRTRIAYVVTDAFIAINLAAGYTLTGQVSGQVVTIAAVDQAPQFTPETGTAAWKILGWGFDLGLTVTNTQSPSGGLYPMLDGLGADKNMKRLPSEGDDLYRRRQSTIADIVTPNAIRRTLNKNLGAIPWCFREVGTNLLPGFFYDQDFYDYDAITITGAPTGTFLNGERVTQNQSGVVVRGRALAQFTGINTPFVPGQAATTGRPTGYTMVGVAGIQSGSIGSFTIVTGVPIVGKVSGATVTPSAVSPPPLAFNRFRVYLDYLRFRGYFLVTVPRLDFGDFGFYYGAGNGSFGLENFYDLPSGFLDFYDGYPTLAQGINRRVYAAVDVVRAAGVFWELGLSDSPCS